MFSFASKTNNPDTRLGWNDRIGYGIGNYGMAWVNGLMSAFFMTYLTNVSMVDAGIAGTIIALSKFFDGISDLIMGRIVDGTKSKLGKGRVWLLRMCIPMAVSVILLFSIPASMTGILKYVYIFVIYNLVNSVFYTAMFVPYNSMIALTTTDGFERGMLGNISMIFQTIANISMNTFFMKWLLYFGDGNMYASAAWTKALLVVGVFIVAASVLCVMGTKERVNEQVTPNGKVKDDVSTMVAVKSLFKNRYWLTMVLCMFVIFFIIVMYSAGAIYYSQYVLGDITLYTPINNALSVSQFATMFFTPFFMKKFGKHRTYQVGLVCMILGFAGTGLCGANLILLILFNVLKGIGLGASGGMAFGMVADTIEYGEWKTGVKTVGMGNAAISAAQKLGLGIGQAALGWILAAGGFDATVEVQSAGAKTSISFLYNWLPVILIAVCIIIMLFYKLDKEMPMILKELDDRRKK